MKAALRKYLKITSLAMLLGLLVLTGCQQSKTETGEEFIVRCKKEVQDLIGEAYSKTSSTETAKLCNQAIIKAFECQYEMVKDFPDSQSSDLLDKNGFGQMDALDCFCEHSLGPLDDQIHTEKDPVRRFELLEKRIQVTVVCQNKWLEAEEWSLDFDPERSPGVGGTNNLDEVIILDATCVSVIDDLKKQLKSEKDEAKKCQLQKKVIEVVGKCYQIWNSELFFPEDAPELGRDFYGTKNVFVDYCGCRMKEAKTGEEKEAIRKECENSFSALYGLEEDGKIKNPFAAPEASAETTPISEKNQNPVISGIEVTQVHQSYDDIPHVYRVSAAASDPEGADLSYEWLTGCGYIVGAENQATIEWHYDVPGECIAAKITVKVSDPAGNSVSLTQNAFQ
ncbi:MAG: hypothetical protein ABIH35_00900 [Patescibacteria group bacterium]